MPILGSVIKRAIELRGKVPKVWGTKNAYKAQKRELKKLLRKAQYTAFGEHYKFQDILRQKDFVKNFQEAVPVHDYNKIFKEWWFRTVARETFVSWPGKIKYYALSSGTSEASSKQIPVTSDMLSAIKKTSIRQIISLARYDLSNDFFQKGILMLGGSTHLQYNGSYYEGDLSGITAGNLPFWFQHFYKPGKSISKERDWSTKLDEIVKKADQWDIGVIVGVPAWLQILLEKIIQHYQVNTIHDIWPNLSIYVHGGVSFGPYQKGFEKLLARPLIYIETYLASEGFIAYQSRPNTNSMELVLNNGMFYEFVPFDNKNFDQNGFPTSQAEILSIDKVQENKEYALLLTSCSGAWRYLIGDTIRFTSLTPPEIIITGRTKHFLSLCGEHLSIDNMTRAIEMVCHKLNIEIREFSIAGIQSGSMFAHKWFIGTDNIVDKTAITKEIDNSLKSLNDDYRVERLAAIREVIVELLPTEVFYNWMKENGKEGSQNKFPRVLKNDVLSNWEEFVSNYKLQQNKL